MKPSYPNPKLNVQVYEEATQWLVEFRTGDPDATAQQRLDDWLRASPDHVRAYLEVSSIWENTALHDEQRTVTAQEHIARALAEDNVIALNPAAARDVGEPIEERSQTSDRRALKSRSFAIAASAAFLCVLAGALTWLYLQRTPTYSTQVGEQRSISLADGSTLQLNARSRVRVHYSAHERTVELLAGQVLFQVAKDKQRPFIVRSGDLQVRAVGTQFDVYKKQGGTIVTVVEGRIAVSNAPAERQAGESPDLPSPAADSIYLSAGQQVSVGVKEVSRPKRIDVATATAWTQRRLVFDAAPLRDVVDEFNRYNARQMVLDGGTGLGDFAIVGVFSSTDPASLLRFLRAQPGINVVEDDTRIVITQQP